MVVFKPGAATQIISSALTGPVYANGGSIVVDSNGSISGGAFGVYAESARIETLTNDGAIGAANGADHAAGGIGVRADARLAIKLLVNATDATISGGAGGGGGAGGSGGAGVSNSGGIATLLNGGTILGGAGGGGFNSSYGGAAGAGVSNQGTITTLANLGAISGGHGGDALFSGGAAGAGVANTGVIASFENSGALNGGAGGNGSSNAASGGAGMSNRGTIATLVNLGAIMGGKGGSGLFAGGTGGAGLANVGAITSLVNSGAITGGGGGSGNTTGAVGRGGSGIVNSGTVTTLSNSGAITGGKGGSTLSGGGGAAAVSNLGAILTLSNTGTISGGAGGDGSDAGQGGAGVANASTLTTLVIFGAIIGGDAGKGYSGYSGGAGVENSSVITTLTNNGQIRGGSGGVGDYFGVRTAGAGVANTGEIATLTNDKTIVGGKGAAGVSGGAGGAGGAGVDNAGTITAFANSGAIRGGEGGDGADAAGGVGLDFTAGGSTFINSGGVFGGVGEEGGSGGDGVIGVGLAIVNSGTIHGGGDADAIAFVGGVNELTLEAGSHIVGDVAAESAADSLALGGSQNSQFNVAKIGSQYLGFGAFTKTGSSTWTLSGATTTDTAWAIDDGALAVRADADLGASSAGLSFDGGALALLSSFATNRSLDLAAAGGTIDVEANHAEIAGLISGDGALTKTGAGKLTLSDANAYGGGTYLDGGVLELAARDAAGTEAITFALGPDTLAIDNSALASNALGNAVRDFGVGDVFNLAGLAFVKGAKAFYDPNADLLTVTSGGVADRLTLVDPLGSAFVVKRDGTGGTDVTLAPVPTTLSV